MTDVTKVFIKIDGLSGKRLESILEIDFNIEVELKEGLSLKTMNNMFYGCSEITSLDLYKLMSDLNNIHVGFIWFTNDKVTSIVYYQ